MTTILTIIHWLKTHYKKGAGVARTAVRVLRDFSAFMIPGAILGILWGILDHDTYESLKHAVLFESQWIGVPHGHIREFTVHYLINDILMGMFFFIAGKELYESFVLPNGALYLFPKGKFSFEALGQATVALVATQGGIIGPALVYLGVTYMLGEVEGMTGWAIPTATDIAFSYVIARIIFGSEHAAIKFLLLLAIADDGEGLVILATVYPTGELQLQWLLLSLVAALFGYYVMQKRWHVENFWWYLAVVGLPSMFAFIQSGIHPVLSLLPVVPTMPHANSDPGLFIESKPDRHDTLSMAEHWWENPMQGILFVFALLNTGVPINAIGTMTWPVMIALVVGKPLGIWVFGMIAAYFLGFPEGINWKTLLVLGSVAGIGFTVALFVSTVALPAGELQDAAKVGALLSFLSAFVAIGLAKLLKVENGNSKPTVVKEAEITPGQ